MTPAEFKALKPQFADVPDVAVQPYLDLAAEQVDASWGASEVLGLAAYACHLMTMDGLGSDGISKSFLSGQSEFQTIKSADVTLTRFQKQAGSTAYADWLHRTPCGQAYDSMLARLRRGPLAATAAGGPLHTSGYAKDARRYGWGGVYDA